MRQVGMPVQLRVEGPTDPVAPGLALTVFRIAQEALTNTLRHAGPVDTEVDLRVGPSSIVLEVRDHGTSGSPPAYPRPASRSGRGLAGMRERAALYGGDVTAGPDPGGGFHVRVELPRSAEEEGAGQPSR